MKEFTDLEGRKWKVVLNAWTLQAVYEGTNVLLTKVIEDNCKILSEIYDKDLLAVSIVWFMISDQAEERDVSKQDFAMSVAGDVLGNIKAAIVAETVDFFDDPATRRSVGKLIDKTIKIAKTIQMETAVRVDQIDEQSMAKAAIDSFGSSPVSAAFIPESTHSAS